jgi:HD-GYP domain-containing protein (c-di-GMP phosphodiesterase class II)
MEILLGNKKMGFFSVAVEFLAADEVIPFDLYINSSSHAVRERFVRIYPAGEFLSRRDLLEFKRKYFQIYLAEEQRHLYLEHLAHSEQFRGVDKARVIKDSAIYYLNSLFNGRREFTTEVLEESLRGCRYAVESMVQVVGDSTVSQVQSLIGNLSYHDFYTYDHSLNVAMYNMAIYKAAHNAATKEDQVMAGLGGLLHDLGKIRVPTNIINNPGQLSDEEFALIRKHPEWGKELILGEQGHKSIGADFNVIQRVIWEHHENYNGSGYPQQIRGEDIHLLSRITSLSDFFDALTTKRSYHQHLDTESAVGVMAKTVGKKLDPALFTIFLTSIEGVKFNKTRSYLPDDFDPCQPHQHLPVMRIDATDEVYGFKNFDFGKILVK